MGQECGSQEKEILILASGETEKFRDQEFIHPQMDRDTKDSFNLFLNKVRERKCFQMEILTKDNIKRASPMEKASIPGKME